MPPNKRMQYEASPGELYKGITAVSENFEGETKLVVERDSEFVIFCKKMYKQFPGLGKGAVYDEAHREAIDFLGWKLSAPEFMAAIKGIAIAGAIPSIIILLLIFVLGIGIDLGGDGEIIGGTFLTDNFDSLAMPIFFMVALAFVSVIGMIVYFIYNYPIAMAEDERNKALTYVPEMVGYLIMSMKLVPNLEKAIEFSAKHGKGKVADDFKRLIWDFQIGVYSSISEGLDMMALRWGKYSTELKEALMKIRASVMEPSESHRYAILDKTMLEVLDSVKEKMGDYARSLNQPSVMLFYIGVLLPLLLVIILPVGSAFIGKVPPGDKGDFGISFANPIILVIIYIFLIPGFAYTFAKGVVKKRPPTYEPPVINDNFAELPKKWQMKMGGFWIDSRIIAALIILIGFGGSFFLSTQGFPPKFLFGEQKEGYESNLFQLIPADKQYEDVYKDKGLEYYGKVTLDLYFIQDMDITKGTAYQNLINSGDLTQSQAEDAVYLEKLQFDAKPANDPTKYVFIAGVMLSITAAFCFMLYYMNIYKRNAQLIVIQMEDEFKESMYMIASRMGENKPVENALKQAKDYLPNLMVSKRIFGKTVENIELMGLPLESAIFDPVYGSMKGIPSKILNTAMRLLVDSVNLGVEVASRTLMSLSLQMENMDKVNKSLKEMVSDVTTTMQTMAVFIAPMVLGITTALQKVVMMTLSDVVASPQLQNTSSAIGDVAGAGGIANMKSIFKVDLDVFRSFATPWMYMVIIGIYVALIVIILTYFTTKIKEDNDLLFKINLAKMLPIAMAVYLLTSIGANYVITMVMTPV
jgi:hypothetical protein